ncbi:hypothetical protein HA44_18790 [Mixta gaviniae]|nr:hypothetical protein HA44_18790 [Mixta gaviniae]
MSEKLSAAGEAMHGAVFTLNDEMIFTPLAQEGCIAWMRCEPLHAGDAFILASAAGEEASFQATQLLKNEFSLRMQLDDGWAVRPVSSTLHHAATRWRTPRFPLKPWRSRRGRQPADWLIFWRWRCASARRCGRCMRWG